MNVQGQAFHDQTQTAQLCPKHLPQIFHRQIIQQNGCLHLQGIFLAAA
jgi:hypothetical protein